jgi:hypothetical protein
MHEIPELYLCYVEGKQAQSYIILADFGLLKRKGFEDGCTGDRPR